MNERKPAEKVSIDERTYDISLGATVHNMRGVLTPIKATSARLLKQVEQETIDPVAIRSRLREMADNAEHLERLVDDIRLFTQPVPPTRTPEQLLDLIESARGIAQCRFPVGRCCIRVMVSAATTVSVARHQIITAFANVLTNAFEAFDGDAGAKSWVCVRACVNESGQVAVVIEDNGFGFDEDEMAQIREFVPGQTTLKPHGTGFGLPTAKRYIEAHGGSLDIDSREHVGTRVTIRLPLLQREDTDQ